MRVVIADDSVLIRAGVVRVLEISGHEVVAETGDGISLLAAVERHRPDAVVVDVRMPPTFKDEGIAAAVQIRDGLPGHGGPGPVAVRRGALRHRPAGPRHRAGRLPAQGPGRRHRLLHRGAGTRRGRRHRAGPRSRRAAPGTPARRPAGPAHSARTRRAGADGRGPGERRDRGGAGGQRERRGQAHQQHLHEARPPARRPRAPACAGRIAIPSGVMEYSPTSLRPWIFKRSPRRDGVTQNARI